MTTEDQLVENIIEKDILKEDSEKDIDKKVRIKNETPKSTNEKRSQEEEVIDIEKQLNEDHSFMKNKSTNAREKNIPCYPTENDFKLHIFPQENPDSYPCFKCNEMIFSKKKKNQKICSKCINK
jgi:hypothetical protein